MISISKLLFEKIYFYRSEMNKILTNLNDNKKDLSILYQSFKA